MTVQSQNPDYGFYGTMSETHPGFQDKLWDLAIKGISQEIGEYPSYIRPFLDSSAGRHFADTVNDLLHDYSPEQSVKLAIKQWMKWKDTSILANPIPLLIARVHHEAIYEEELLGCYR